MYGIILMQKRKNKEALRKWKIFRELKKSSKKKTYNYWQQRDKRRNKNRILKKNSLENKKKKLKKLKYDHINKNCSEDSEDKAKEIFHKVRKVARERRKENSGINSRRPKITIIPEKEIIQGNLSELMANHKFLD